jgi:hypothetical protein
MSQIFTHSSCFTESEQEPTLAWTEWQLSCGLGGRIPWNTQRIAETWEDFMQMMEKAYPRRGDTLQLSLFENDEFYLISRRELAVAK